MESDGAESVASSFLAGNPKLYTVFQVNGRSMEPVIQHQDIVVIKSYRSVRELTKDFGRSRQFVFVYLEALASISIIGMNPHGYYIKTRLGIEQLGSYIQPGILGVLKKYSVSIRP